MAKRRKKRIVRTVHLSAGPLPERLALRFPDQGLVFTDASRLQHGGLAVVIYRTTSAQPDILTRRVALNGSNELELDAAILGLAQASRIFPERPFALFSDNQDAIVRLCRIKSHGAAQDARLQSLHPGIDLDGLLRLVTPCWVQGHGRCRGNALADAHARLAAGGEIPPEEPVNPGSRVAAIAARPLHSSP